MSKVVVRSPDLMHCHPSRNLNIGGNRYLMARIVAASIFSAQANEVDYSDKSVAHSRAHVEEKAAQVGA